MDSSRERIGSNNRMVAGGGGGGSGAATTAQERLERERERERERRTRLGKSLGAQVSSRATTQTTQAAAAKERPRSLQAQQTSSSATSTTATTATSARRTNSNNNNNNNYSSTHHHQQNPPPTPGPKPSAVNANYHRRRAATTTSSLAAVGLGLVVNNSHRDVANNNQNYQNNNSGGGGGGGGGGAGGGTRGGRGGENQLSAPPPAFARSGRKETPRPPQSSYPPPPPPFARRDTVIHIPSSAPALSSRTAPSTPLKATFGEHKKQPQTPGQQQQQQKQNEQQLLPTPPARQPLLPSARQPLPPPSPPSPPPPPPRAKHNIPVVVSTPADSHSPPRGFGYFEENLQSPLSPSFQSPPAGSSPASSSSFSHNRRHNPITPTTTEAASNNLHPPPLSTSHHQDDDDRALTPPKQPTATSSRTPSPTACLSPRRRSPARFSSNGVATSTGPPPALSYRQPSKMDNPNRSLSNYQLPGYSDQQSTTGRSSNSSSTISARQSYSRTNPSNTETLRREPRRRSVDYDGFFDDEDLEAEDKDRTIRGLEDLQRQQDGGVSIGGQQQQQQQQQQDGDEQDQDQPDRDQPEEDVFLRLARTTSITSQAGRVERKRARLSQYAQNVRNSLPAQDISASSPLVHSQTSEINSSPPQAAEDVWRQNAHLSSPIDYHSRRTSTQSDTIGGNERTSTTPRQNLLSRPISLLRRERSPAGPTSGGHSRSFSMVDSASRSRNIPTPMPNRQIQSFDETLKSPIELHHPQFPGHHGHEIMGHGEEEHMDDGEGSAHGGSQSSVATSAASSVWDELDDLKSRIRRLEVTGRMPASGSNSSGDRPRTATTTVTTIASSPRRKDGTSTNGISPANSTFSVAPSAAAHPLLHAALNKSKQHIAADLYKHLESAANDGLSLAALVGAPGSGTPGTFASDRQARRKVDSMCRSLTELCIALSDSRPLPRNGSHLQSPLSTRDRPASRDRSTGRESMFSGRESSLETRRRFADRKGSLGALSSAGGYTRSHSISDQPGLPSLDRAATIRHRNSLIIKSHRTGDDDDDDRASRYRAPSRATTEVASRRSRDYNPNATPAPPLPISRRQYTQNSLSSPVVSSTSRRFFSNNRDEDIHQSPLGRTTIRDDRTLPGKERLTSSLQQQEEEYDSGRFRSGSIGRSPTARRVVTRGLREDVDLDRERDGGARLGVRR